MGLVKILLGAFLRVILVRLAQEVLRSWSFGRCVLSAQDVFGRP